MTALRPERESAAGGPVDPLTDPLPDVLAGGHSSPWFRAEQPPQQAQGHDLAAHQPPPADPYAQLPADVYAAPPQDDAYAGHHPYDGGPGWTASPEPYPAPEAAEEPYSPVVEAPRDDETMALRAADPARTDEERDETPPATTTAAGAEGGRAARRKAAKRNARPGGRRGTGRRRAGAPAPEASGTPGGGDEPPERPRTRVEARRAERARKPSAATVASRAVGELFITIGVLMLLFVTYQLWWTNVRAQQQADGAAHNLQQDWEQGKRKPGAFQAGQGFAILHIPKLDVVVPVASGIDKQRVLDRGMAGHYAEGALKTALPSAKEGNFAVAGHRNTHGEPFRYINRLTPGDPIVVETQDTYYVYEMASILPQTPPSNTAVIDPVPAGSGFTEPGRYLTLTTCTPEFTSTYRMIVWGKMVEERPRSKGKPDALVD
ncbi:class E sortase [Streptomyces albidoflavus]|uniref:class E sortase n=1 Tax=Streptomyces albidoflavus TaxID=1886 RepID=UPI0010221DDC|nr:class E sortase [Streptomyces albidoflavus]RZE21470.1 class E sortase [Streptomyces albidoflavus]RZE41410.1 class E sortase [Streptomyces albidoflavus]